MSKQSIITVDFLTKQVVSNIDRSQIDGLLYAGVVELVKGMPSTCSILNVRPNYEGNLLPIDLQPDQYGNCVNLFADCEDPVTVLTGLDGADVLRFDLVALHHDYMKGCLSWLHDEYKKPVLAQMILEALIFHVAEGGAMVIVLPVHLKANYLLRAHDYFENVSGYDQGMTDEFWSTLVCKGRNKLSIPGPHYWLSAKTMDATGG